MLEDFRERFSLAYLRSADKGSQREATMQDLSDLFDQVATAAKGIAEAEVLPVLKRRLPWAKKS